MTLGSWKQNVLLVAVFLLASAAPDAFPLSMMGYGSLHDLALWLIVPSAALLLILGVVSWWRGSQRMSRILVHGSIAGVLGTLALEAIRYPGFLLGFMPGNLPELMGVLLLDRFAHGPSLLSNVAGFTYHFWNGACLGVMFAVLVPQGRSRLFAVLYGVALGLGFLVSPVLQGLGVGLFGVNFGWQFSATVLTAHLAFGAVLGLALSALDGARHAAKRSLSRYKTVEAA
jgi:hypothetical protein